MRVRECEKTVCIMPGAVHEIFNQNIVQNLHLGRNQVLPTYMASHMIDNNQCGPVVGLFPRCMLHDVWTAA